MDGSALTKTFNLMSFTGKRSCYTLERLVFKMHLSFWEMKLIKIGSNEVKTGMQKCKTTDNKTWLVCSTNLSQRHSCRGRQLKVLRHNRQWCKNINATFYDGGDGGCNVNDGYTVSLCYGNVVLTWATLTQRASWWHITSL